GTKGGMARVATIRKLLLQENPNTITVVSGDVVSPSALVKLFFVNNIKELCLCKF
ncbi:unnamed protein product, partial [Rotaria socialis]